MKIRDVLQADVSILNKYFLTSLILVLLTIVGYTSYALFSYEEISENGIRVVYTGSLVAKGNLAKTWKDKTENEASYLALYTYNKKDLPNTYNYNGATYTLNTSIDVSEQGDETVFLGEYKNGSNMIAVIGQDGKVMAPADSSNLFQSLTNVVLFDFGYFNTVNATKMNYMFSDCTNLTSLDLSSFNTSKVTTMARMFYNCSSLTSINLSSFNTSEVTTMARMFHVCSSLTSLDLSNFNTSKVTDMSYMFSWLTSLTNLDLSSFDTSSLKDINHMFYSSSSIASIDLSSFTTPVLTNMNFLFSGCSGLTTLDVSSFNTSNVTSMSSSFYGCSKLKILDLSNFDTNKVTSMTNMFSDCSGLTKITVGCNWVITSSNKTTNMFSGASVSAVTKEC